jgi:hypothetical protein
MSEMEKILLMYELIRTLCRAMSVSYVWGFARVANQSVAFR